MKNLANCGAREFMRQTAKIRHAVEKWLTLTDILNIRKRLPEIPNDATKADREKLMAEQARKNITMMLDAIMDEHPDETMDLLALMCFVEPQDVDSHSIGEYMGALSEMLNNEDVMNFFLSLARLARQVGLMG